MTPPNLTLSEIATRLRQSDAVRASPAPAAPRPVVALIVSRKDERNVAVVPLYPRPSAPRVELPTGVDVRELLRSKSWSDFLRVLWLEYRIAHVYSRGYLPESWSERPSRAFVGEDLGLDAGPNIIALSYDLDTRNRRARRRHELAGEDDAPPTPIAQLAPPRRIPTRKRKETFREVIQRARKELKHVGRVA